MEEFSFVSQTPWDCKCGQEWRLRAQALDSGNLVGIPISSLRSWVTFAKLRICSLSVLICKVGLVTPTSSHGSCEAVNTQQVLNKRGPLPSSQSSQEAVSLSRVREGLRHRGKPKGAWNGEEWCVFWGVAGPVGQEGGLASLERLVDLSWTAGREALQLLVACLVQDNF